MKFILAFSICSAITGFCNTTSTIPAEFNSWSECINAGGKFIQTFSTESIDEQRLYMSYFCNEIKYD